MMVMAMRVDPIVPIPTAAFARTDLFVPNDVFNARIARFDEPFGEFMTIKTVYRIVGKVPGGDYSDTFSVFDVWIVVRC
jgi:hypothetical protein